MTMLRILCDFQSGTVDGWCYVLRYQDRWLDEVAGNFDLHEGMRVVLYWPEPGHEIECDGVLSFRSASPALGRQWMALVNEGTFREVATDK